MTLLRDIVGLVTKAASERPAQTPIMANLAGIVGQSLGMVPQLQTYGQSAVLFAIVRVIGDAVASTHWELYQTGRGDRKLIEKHPFLDLWDMPNPFTTRMEFLEAAQQHMDLVGEMWWIKAMVNGKLELWPVRPDRMRAVPHPTEFISGYEYRIGQQRIPLRLEDVVFQRMPNPMDAYRGLGPVGALLVDIQGEKAATDWSRQFFRNSAEPGGIIELDDELSDADFAKFTQHWQQQHQGVSNAHRVAIIERGHWKDRSINQREMQFEQLRRFNIDLFLLAFGVHKHILGMAGDVNRANAEAAEDSFARWVVKPRLDRIKGAVNELLLPDFGENLELDYVDPTPDDRDRNLKEATEGWTAGLLRLNEARQRMGGGLEDVPEEEGGEEFHTDPVPQPFGGIDDPSLLPPEDDEEDEDAELESVHRPHKPKPRKVLRAANDDLIEDPVQAAESRIQRGWQRRLAAELRDLSAFIGERMKGWAPIVKIELSDLDGYDWDWFTKYGNEVTEELALSFQAVIMGAMPNLALPRAQDLAVQFAQFRAAELLRLDGAMSMVTQTRERVRILVADTIEQGDSLNTLAEKLRQDPVFDRRRAETVARTETRFAMGRGQRGAALEQGRDEKRLITQGAGDPRVDPDCLANERQGWIGIEQPFQSGHDTVPIHPNCLCTVVYRTGEQHLNANGTGSTKRCSTCNTGLSLNLKGDGLYCTRCKVVVDAPVIRSSRRRVERDEYGRVAGLVEEEMEI